MKLVKRLVVLVVVPVLGLIGLASGYFAYQYPYGPSHCCDLGLMFALDEYARTHGGVYPTGEATPEASLSLLYPTYTDANTLRGKTVPKEVVQGILDKGGRLGPETCGWHYVEGLRSDDDHKLAVFWDKVPGLDHNGGRVSSGGHNVLFIGFRREHIPAADWDAFLVEQERLLKEIKAKRGHTP